MLFSLKNAKAGQLESALTERQKAGGPDAWANLPDEELFTPAGFHPEQAEATAYSNYSYWGSTLRSFLKNRFAVALLVALAAVVAFAFVQPHLPGQMDPTTVFRKAEGMYCTSGTIALRKTCRSAMRASLAPLARASRT